MPLAVEAWPHAPHPRARGRAPNHENQYHACTSLSLPLPFPYLFGEQGVALPEVGAELVKGEGAGEACSGEEG